MIKPYIRYENILEFWENNRILISIPFEITNTTYPPCTDCIFANFCTRINIDGHSFDMYCEEVGKMAKPVIRVSPETLYGSLAGRVIKKYRPK